MSFRRLSRQAATALILSCAHSLAALPSEDPAGWQRWLESAAPAYSVSADLSIDSRPGAQSASTAGRSAGTESLLQWTEHTLLLIQKYQQNPQRAARALAIVHAAMHDAFVVAARESMEPSGIVAAHRAAALTLAYLYPYEQVAWIEGKGLALAQSSADKLGVAAAERDRALAIGAKVASDAMHRALVDGADRRLAVPRPVSSAPGRWRAAPPLNIHTPQEPLAGEWLTWAADAKQVQPPPPPDYGSARFLEEAEEVYRVWQKLTPRQKAVADGWNLQQGSVTPPGVWNQRAIALIRSQRLEPAPAARVLAALNVAMHDAAIACWRSKYQWWVVRPVTVIREKWDPAFLPHLITPPHPSYVSGHASVSGAAEVALAAFFPGRKSELRALAEEAALSRLYGGIHYRSDNDEGLRLGRRVGEVVMKKALGAAAQASQGEAGKTP